MGAGIVAWTLDTSWFFRLLGVFQEPAFAAAPARAIKRNGAPVWYRSDDSGSTDAISVTGLARPSHPKPEYTPNSRPSVLAAPAIGAAVIGSTRSATNESMKASESPLVNVALPTLDAIIAEHGPYVWRVLRRLGVRASDIDDVWQETFIVVHRKLDTFEGRAQLRTWLSAIAVRVASDYRSRAYRRREQATEEVPEASAEHTGHRSQHDDLVEQQRRALLDRLIAELKPEQREVIVLYEFAELPMQEVADALGCPLQTAYSRLHAARKALEAAAKRETARKGFV